MRVGGDQAGPARWIEPWSALLLFATMLYTVVGLPSFDRDTVLDTDYVSPVNRYIWLALLLLALPVLKRRWREAAALLGRNWPLLALLGYFALSTLWALDPGASIRRLIFSLVQLLLLLILVAGIRRGPILHCTIAAACLLAALGDVATWVAMPGYAMTDEGFAGFQLQKNQTGLLMMVGCLSAGTAVFLVGGRIARVALALGTLLMFALLLATRSTTSLVVVVMTPLLMPLVIGLSRRRRRAIAAALATVLLIPAAALLLYLAWCSISGADPWLPLRGVTFTSRTDLWQFTWGEIAKRPWFGAGYSSFWAIDPRVQPSLQVDAWFSDYAIINEAHDGYLDLLATGGVFGLAGGLFVLCRAIGTAFRALGRARTAAAAWTAGGLAFPTAVFHLALLLGLVVHNTMESNLFSNTSLLAVALLICLLDLQRLRPVRAPAPDGVQAARVRDERSRRVSTTAISRI